MTDILVINNSTDLGTEDDCDRLARLKNKVRKRKGRGFQGELDRHERIKEYECLKDDDDTPGPQKSVEGWILFITGVHEEATEEDLHEKFSEYGNIKNIHVNLDRRTGFLKGYSLIEYDCFYEANNARISLDKSDLLGQSISVNWCFVKNSKKIPKKDQRKIDHGAGDNYHVL